MDKHSGSDIKMNSEAKADRARPTVQIREGTTTYTRTEHMSHVACCMKLLLPPKKRAKTMAQAMKPIQRGRQSVANPRKNKTTNYCNGWVAKGNRGDNESAQLLQPWEARFFTKSCRLCWKSFADLAETTNSLVKHMKSHSLLSS